jgi:hypothetical protein
VRGSPRAETPSLRSREVPAAVVLRGSLSSSSAARVAALSPGGPVFERVKSTWEERFERSYGFWQGCVDDVVLAFQACGDFEGGFARIYCDACRSEFLVAFSCSRRVFCPSCAAKRSAIFGALLREEILEEVGHAQWVFTIPKLLRPYFLYHRELLFTCGLGDQLANRLPGRPRESAYSAAPRPPSMRWTFSHGC